MRPYIRDRREQCENDETVRPGGSCGGACWLWQAAADRAAGKRATPREQVQTILDSGAFTDELDELDCDTARALYQLEEAGLSREDLTDGVIYRSAGATSRGAVPADFLGQRRRPDRPGRSGGLSSESDREQPGLPSREILKLEDAVLRQEGSTVLLAVSG